ncbi:hypothetical protein ACEPAI_4199 [Sanghuangporus weigelae]
MCAICFIQSSSSVVPSRAPGARKHRFGIDAANSLPAQSSSSQFRKTEPFHQGASVLPTICAIYLGSGDHDIQSCSHIKIWDGSQPSRCYRGPGNALLNQTGRAVCIRFQLIIGCSEQHSYLHECSGCGSPSHGAIGCKLTQK